MAVCAGRFPDNNQYYSHWATYIWTSIDPGTNGEPECAIRCMLNYYERCHFYAWISNRCYFGDFARPGQTILFTTYDNTHMQMFPLNGLYGIYLKNFVIFTTKNTKPIRISYYFEFLHQLKKDQLIPLE